MTGDELRSRFRGALVGVAVGDAHGARWEGDAGVPDVALDLEALGGDELAFTDDTRMTIALAESLLERGDLDPEHLVRTFASAYEAEPWRGYGPGPPRIFRRVRDGLGWKDAARELYGGEGSLGNGAAMRVAPAALFAHPEVDRAAELARRQAAVTHTHPLGVDGAAVEAAAVALALLTPGSLDPGVFVAAVGDHATEADLLHRLTVVADLLPHAEPEDVVEAVGNGIEAVEAVPAAIASVALRPGSFADALTFAFSLGGDTDTIGAMTGAIAGALHGEEAIPVEWWSRTEGVERLRRLADALLSAG